MDEPARKKRRTLSPRERDRSLSPLKKPPRRPSFASPTKASLARFNPHLLSPADLRAAANQARGSVFNEQSKKGLSRNGREQTTAGANRTLSKELDVTSNSRGSRASVNREGAANSEEESEQSTTVAPRSMVNKAAARQGMLFPLPNKRPRLEQSTRAPHAPQKENEKEIREPDADAGAEQIDNLVKIVESPNAELEKKKREKERLQRELAALQRDNARCVEWIQKLQDRYVSARLGRKEQDDIISFINRVEGPDVPQEEDSSPTVSTLLSSFLPYQILPVPRPKNAEDIDDPVPSHQPVQLDDPLPYLQLFTAFSCESRLSIPDPGELDSETREWSKKITFNIEAPKKLFTSSIDATIDARDHQVTRLTVFWASAWSATELQKFIQTKERENDLGSISWAIGSYWELTKKRAQHWHRCETQWAQFIAGRTNEDKENLDHTSGKPTTNMTRKDLLRHLGRDNLVLQNKHVQLRLSWRIGFDWTGEAESTLTVEPSYPRVWSEADSRATLKSIPETFDSLVRFRGAFEATKIIMTLLFGE